MYPSLPRDASALLDPMECTDMAEEQRVHSPPASLVPRIHVILAQKLQHINPLLPTCLNKEESRTCQCECWGLPMAGSLCELQSLLSTGSFLVMSVGDET